NSFTHPDSSLLSSFCGVPIPAPASKIPSLYRPRTKDKTASVGGKVTLTCVVAESDNSSLQWSNTAQQTLYFGEKRALRDNRIQLSRSTPTELSITISEVQLSDEGIYTCSIFTMPVRTAQAIVTVLGVPGKPQISGFEDAVPEGSEVTLTCTSTGSKPPAKLRWYQGDQELQGKMCSLFGTTVSELTLKVSRSDDNALITCAVDHESLAPGDKRSEQVLRVLCESTGIWGIWGGGGGLRGCWGKRGGKKCKKKKKMWEKKNGEFPPLAKVEGAYLHFEMLNKSDNGVYLCYAGNGIGTEGLGEYTLQVQDPTAMSTTSGGDHAVIGGVVAVIVFILLCLLIVLGRYLIRHKGHLMNMEEHQKSSQK
uniref:Cell adhesion molecule 3 n=1 Tax=Sphaeramia orbicularis TaxID=375764 RepID=A0A673AES1_9TELE